MKNLLSPDGEDALRTLIQSHPLFAFDFEGTLSPTSIMPERARMTLGVYRGFRSLCAVAPVAIIAGRSVADVSQRLLTKPHYLIGDFGAEGGVVPPAMVLPFRDICSDWMQQIMQQLRWQDMDPSLSIEQNACSIRVHFRFARDREKVARAVEASLSQLHPAPQIIAGKYSIHLLPQGAPDKRLALECLLRHEEKQCALYIGDDDADEVVFRHAPRDWLTVKVGRDRHSSARFFLHHQNEMTECLQLIVRLVQLQHQAEQTALRRSAGTGRSS
ncbi:MAG: trehalose-phosphatase [Burkholderiales bacterium]|nr:trehalose-phosphatase [Burkholderiales bacterium]